jgi:hypothetical protein
VGDGGNLEFSTKYSSFELRPRKISEKIKKHREIRHFLCRKEYKYALPKNDNMSILSLLMYKSKDS